MNKNPNFHSRGGRPVFTSVQQGDTELCYMEEKVRAIIGYFSLAPCAIKHELSEYSEGVVLFKLNGKYIQLYVNGSYRKAQISMLNDNQELSGGFFSLDMYLRHTIDRLILNIDECILRLAGLDSEYGSVCHIRKQEEMLSNSK